MEAHLAHWANLPMTPENYDLTGFEGTMRFLVSRGVLRDNAKELAQAAWARGWEQLNQLRDESTVTSWVNMIALNSYRRAVERQNITLHSRVSETTMIYLAAIDLARNPCLMPAMRSASLGAASLECYAVRVKLVRVGVRDTGTVQGVDNQRKEQIRARESGNVVHHDRNPFAGLDDLIERRAPDRL